MIFFRSVKKKEAYTRASIKMIKQKFRFQEKYLLGFFVANSLIRKHHILTRKLKYRTKQRKRLCIQRELYISLRLLSNFSGPT